MIGLIRPPIRPIRTLIGSPLRPRIPIRPQSKLRRPILQLFRLIRPTVRPISPPIKSITPITH